MHLVKLLLDLIEETRRTRRDVEALRFENREFHRTLHLHTRLLEQIHHAVVPEKVKSVILVGENEMDLKVGQTIQPIGYLAKGPSGNPTVPVGQPQWSADNVTDFTVSVASDSQTATVTAIGAVDAVLNISVNVDGIESNVFTYKIVGSGPTQEPVASVELTGGEPIPL